MSRQLVGYGNANFVPTGYAVSTKQDDLNTTLGSHHLGSKRRHSKERSAVKYIVTDPNDVKFEEQREQYPTVHQGKPIQTGRSFVPLEKPGHHNYTDTGIVNTAYEDADDEGLTPAARARAERRSRRRERRQQREQSMSPDTSSEEVTPYLMTQQTPPKKGIIKDSRNSSQDESMEAQHHHQLTPVKQFHLKKRGEEGYGFAFRNGKVSVVKEGSEAEHAGLLVGDKIVEVNGVSMEGKDRDEILKTIVRNKKNLILVVLDETIQSDLNESSGSASEFSDSVDRSSGSSVRFQLEGRSNTLKPGVSVASLDMVPSKQVVNFNPDPQPSSRRHRQRSNQPHSGQHRPQSGSRNSHGSSRGHSGQRSMSQSSQQRHSDRGSQRRRSRSRSPASQVTSSRPHTNGHANNNIPKHGSANYAYEMNNEQITTLDANAPSVITDQPTNKSQYPTPANGAAVNVQDMTDTMEYQGTGSSEDPGGICCATYKTWAALVLIFCIPCFPMGAAAFVYASRSSKAYADKDPEKGRKYGTTAGYFIAAGLMLGAMAWLGLIVGVVFAGG